MLSPLFYKRNFGQATKSHFELIMFKYFLDCLYLSGIVLSDYEIGYFLGITEKKVRLLKEKVEFQYKNYDERYLKSKLIDVVQKVIFDEKKVLIKVLVNDISLMIHIRQKLESLGLYDEYQLNAKLFQCRPEVFFVLLSSLDFRGTGNYKTSLIAVLSDVKGLCSDADNEILSGVIDNLSQHEDGASPLTLYKCLKDDLVGQVPILKNTLNFVFGI